MEKLLNQTAATKMQNLQINNVNLRSTKKALDYTR